MQEISKQVLNKHKYSPKNRQQIVDSADIIHFHSKIKTICRSEINFNKYPK